MDSDAAAAVAAGRDDDCSLFKVSEVVVERKSVCVFRTITNVASEGRPKAGKA